MDDGNEIVSEMTVTISKQATEVFRKNKVDCRQFLESKSSGSFTVEEVDGTYRLTGSYEGIRHIRKELNKELEMFANGGRRQPQANSLQNTKDTELRESTPKTRDDVGGGDVRATPSTSHRSLQDDITDKHSQSTEGQLSQEATMQESLVQPKRIRKLKSPTPGDDTSMEAGAQRALPEKRVDDDWVVLNEETRKPIESGDSVSIEVDKDRHHYLITHFGHELKKELPQFHEFVAEEGKYKVAFASNSKKKGGDRTAITAKYTSLLDRFHFEIVRVPDGVDGTVLRSLVATSDDKDLSFVLDEDNKIYKLIGKRKKVDRIKKVIDEHVMKASEQLNPSKETEGWKVQNSKGKGKKTASILFFSMEHGKLNRCESPQTSATKNGSLQVSLFESKTKAPGTEAIVRAVDSKMQLFGDAKAAIDIEFEKDKKYKDECRRILNENHKNVPVDKVHTIMTGDFKQKTKIKYILHVVLGEKKTPEASVVVMKDAIFRCLHHAENQLQTKSITFPHLGGSDYCDIGSFVRGSVEALQSLTSTSHRHLQRVCFVVKDPKTLQELAEEFESCVDHQHDSELTSSSESSNKGHSTSL